MKSIFFFLGLLFIGSSLSFAQADFFFPDGPSFDPAIPSPEAFLGYEIGSHHTRHDRILAYLETLAELSERASLQRIGTTHEQRQQVILTISHPRNMDRLSEIQQIQQTWCDPATEITLPPNQPVLTHLGYNVHGNEPSSSEAALLTAYYLVAGQGKEVEQLLQESVVFIDPVINPDGRDRHTHWANMHKGQPLVSDPLDREHNEAWPGGRTNHYWFDLNRDWLLLVNPELQAKLAWYHQWLPNVTTDFHEMGSHNTYFFEPMKTNGSQHPIMPQANYTTLNDSFAEFYRQSLDEIGSLYFTKEVFDGTYPGYGSSYPDLQGGLGILFEQASARGHQQYSPRAKNGLITFSFAIRNHLATSLATIRAGLAHKQLLQTYQRDFFQSALQRAKQDPVRAYVFGDSYDPSRNRAFLDLLLQHQIEVYPIQEEVQQEGQHFQLGSAWLVPTHQPQYRMVQTMFETYETYHDSVFYDASAWSIANAYNLPYAGLTDRKLRFENPVNREKIKPQASLVKPSEYAYVMEWEDYFAPAALHQLQEAGLVCMSAFQPFTIDGQSYSYGTVLIPVGIQSFSPTQVHGIVQSVAKELHIPFTGLSTGYSQSGKDLGSNSFRVLSPPRVLMLVGEGVSSYEAGEVWHLLDTRVKLPITKVDVPDWSRINWAQYQSLVLVSGQYDFSSDQLRQLKNWLSDGGTLITTRTASSWAIKNGLAGESLVTEPIDTATQRRNFDQAGEISGAQQVGGAIFQVDLDLSHPLAFGYRRRDLPVYRNSRVFLQPSQNPYSTVAQYLPDPHIDGYVSKENLDLIRNSAALLVSPVGRGRVILFSDNPNFRGTWYGTNRLFLNALFLGNLIEVPD